MRPHIGTDHMQRITAITALALVLTTGGAFIPAEASKWISCVRNKTTGVRGWALGARYVDLGTSVPFRPNRGSIHPKYQVSPDAEVGECLVSDEMLKHMMN